MNTYALALTATCSTKTHRHLKRPTTVSATTILRTQRTHSMPQEKIEIIKSLDNWVSQNILPLVKPVEKSWQPHDMLPDSSLPSDEFIDQVRTLRYRTRNLPDDYLVVLAGSMITEEALPSYQTWLNNHDGVADKTGSCSSSWAKWSRSWTSEENRHGDLLRTYLYLSGHVDMKMVEKTIQYLIAAGVDLKTENNPYMGLVYTSFQERATFITHGNMGRLANEEGDPILARICGTIAADEKRHENAYVKIVEKLLEVDPTGTMIAISDMMKNKITMPAHLMNDGKDRLLFDHFSAVVSQSLRVYTTSDYADVMEFLIGRWRLEKLEGLTTEGRHAQEFVCKLAQRIKRLSQCSDERASKMEPNAVKFSWIFNKEVLI